MAVRDWHGGKIVLFWVVAAVATVILAGAGSAMADCYDCSEMVQSYGIIILIIGAAGPFISSVVVTWKWLSGRENS